LSYTRKAAQICGFCFVPCRKFTICISSAATSPAFNCHNDAVLVNTYEPCSLNFFGRRAHDACNLGVANPPLYVTENGAAFYDPPVAEGGVIDDPLRVDYLNKHIAAIGTAIAKGADVRGYMLWSFLDNLEWSLGYSKRSGIVHVNFKTLERTPKRSAPSYASIISTNAECLFDKN
jgi:hypothetical protein